MRLLDKENNRKELSMKRLITASTMLAFFVVSGNCAMARSVAVQRSVTQQHAIAYQRAYRAVVRKYGARTPGRNIVNWGWDAHHKATDAQVLWSLAILNRMLQPPPVVTATTSGNYSASNYSSASVAAPSSGLASCIISRESGGNPQAANGQYTGIAQWSPSSWAGGGGTQYAASPSQASYSQQLAVLNSMLANGQAGQWTPYDGC